MGLSIAKLFHRKRTQPEPLEASLKRCRFVFEHVEVNSGDALNIAEAVATHFEPHRPCMQLLEPLKVLWDKYPTGRPPGCESDPLREQFLASLAAEIEGLESEVANRQQVASARR
ncbi:MAG: hypothetical protein EOO40_11435 [Deltaproteobacteria bacterium]|nr:MAG: hypothetical protein EOO40_11435 [Deltaproteobacteria bacterium]